MCELQIVSNSVENHFQSIKELFATPAKRVIIASPYLANDFQELLREFSFKNVESIELITTFKPYDPEQFSKPYILKDFFNFFQKNYPNIKVKLHVDNKLHGKIYISSFESQFTAIISSANFTRNGLIHNHEFGLKIDNATVIECLIDDLFSFIDYQDITYNQILRACQFADQDKMNHPNLHIQDQIYSNILNSVYSVDVRGNINSNYFLKPIGDSENPVLLKDKSDFSALHQNLHFSKKKPQGIKKGDVIITTAVGGGSLLSYFKVTGGLLEVTADEIATDPWKERWPWYMEGRNQATEFSSQWWLHNIQRNKALKEFLEIYSNVPITQAGGFTLGTLNMGNDKVKITKEFGDFLISKIENSKL